MKRYTIYQDKDREGVVFQTTSKSKYVEFMTNLTLEDRVINIEDLSDLSLVLVSYEASWADEMEIEGHYICTADEWIKTKTVLNAIEDSFSYYLGTNEEIEYENGTAALEDFSVQPLTTAQAGVLYELDLSHVGFPGPEGEDY